MAQEMVTIRLPLTRSETEDKCVGLNGKRYLIKRGVDVKVPRGVAEILKRSEDNLQAAIAYENKASKKLSEIANN